MKYSVMKKWVKALRSGKYEQGSMFLQCKNTYCCLGVLCDIAKKEKIKVNHDNGELNGMTLGDQFKVKQWSGLKTNSGDYNSDVSLTSMNDDGKTFKEIATFIQKNYKKL